MCTIFSYKNENKGVWVGRNFDWIQGGGRVHLIPSRRSYGMKTNGLILIEQMGEDRPYDGFNDKGVFVGMAAVVNSDIKSGFKDMNDLGLIRYILERASTAEEALYIAKKYDLDYMEDNGYPKVHYMFVDKLGNVVIYEEGETEKSCLLDINEGEVITNFSYNKVIPCERNEKVREHFDNKLCNLMDVKDILEDVKQQEIPDYSTNSTIYSAFYDLEQGILKFWVEGNYIQEYSFHINELIEGQKCMEFGELRLKVQMNKG